MSCVAWRDRFDVLAAATKNTDKRDLRTNTLVRVVYLLAAYNSNNDRCLSQENCQQMVLFVPEPHV